MTHRASHQSQPLSNGHAEAVSVQQDIWYFHWFCIVFCILGNKRKGSYLLYVPLYSHLEDLWRSLSGFLLSTSLVYIFILYTLCQKLPSVLFDTPFRLTGCYGNTCVTCQSERVKVAFLS